LGSGARGRGPGISRASRVLGFVWQVGLGFVWQGELGFVWQDRLGFVWQGGLGFVSQGGLRGPSGMGAGSAVQTVGHGVLETRSIGAESVKFFLDRHTQLQDNWRCLGFTG
jgi:hypothetical protein